MIAEAGGKQRFGGRGRFNRVTEHGQGVPAQSHVVVGIVGGLVLLSAPLGAQSTLEVAIQEASAAWKDHRVTDLVSKSDTVRLHLPGIAMSASLRPGQASKLLREFLEDTEELEFDLRDVRQLADDHAYAEMVRVYVVKGTTEKRTETVFLGFRVLGGQWSLREVRITP